jgi:hypothetical protein
MKIRLLLGFAASDSAAIVFSKVFCNCVALTTCTVSILLSNLYNDFDSGLINLIYVWKQTEVFNRFLTRKV